MIHFRTRKPNLPHFENAMLMKEKDVANPPW